jgi:hypothetical protein
MFLPTLGHQLIGKDLVFVVVKNNILPRQEAIPGARVSEAVRKHNSAAISCASHSIVALLSILLNSAPSTRKDVHEWLIQELDANNIGCATIALSDLGDDAGGEGDGVSSSPARRGGPLARIVETVL